MTYPIPDTALAQHTAIVGKTGSGKTCTGKSLVEHLVAQGARVCILDPIKSDWWGLISSADGQQPGLPFHVLGGPHGHVPLHEASGGAIAGIVANGDLPLSIIDMVNFGPGGQCKFFVDFAETLRHHMRGVVHLVIEEAHIFAPKEKSGMGSENMSTYYAKLLATAGRSMGIRLIVLTQRTQALHNAVLGSCETVIAHRLTAPADQKPVMDWLKANAPKDIAAEVTSSLSQLRTGTGWVCSGEEGLFEKVRFPRITTYDNSATPMAEDMRAPDVKTAQVDIDKLRAIIGDAAEEAAANDPTALKAEIVQLKKDLIERDVAEKPGSWEKGLDEGIAIGREDGFDEGVAACKAMVISKIMASTAALNVDITASLPNGQKAEDAGLPAITLPVVTIECVPENDGAIKLSSGARMLAETFERLYPRVLKPKQAAILGGQSIKSSAFPKNLKAIIDARLIEPVEDGFYRALSGSDIPMNSAEAIDFWASRLGGSAASILRVLWDNAGVHYSRAFLAQAAGISPTSSGLGTAIKTLVDNGLAEKFDGAIVIAKCFRPDGKDDQ